MTRERRDDDAGRANDLTRRDFLNSTAVGVGAAALGAGPVRASDQAAPEAVGTRRPGLLLPQQNQVRSVLDTSGFWQFQLDPDNQGETQGWFKALPNPRTIAVPCSWNDLFDDAKNYLGLSWYRTDVWVPQGWKGQRVFVRVGSANYAAKVWVNGVMVAQHLGGHLPFVAEITSQLAWDRATSIAISVENIQRPDRVPAGPSPAGGLFSGMTGGFPATTYDFFPYAGLHRQVLLFAVPQAHVDDVVVTTRIEGGDGVVSVKVTRTSPSAAAA